MGKILDNIYAFVNGFRKTMLIKLFNKRCSVKSNMRLFLGAELNPYRLSICKIGSALRIDKNARVVCVNGAKLSIGNSVGIGSNNYIICRKQISIGDGTILGPNVMIYDHDHVFLPEHGVSRTEYTTGEISIGKNCWIGAMTVILKGTHIGDNCVIGAGTVIKGDIPDGTVYIQKRKEILFRKDEK